MEKGFSGRTGTGISDIKAVHDSKNPGLDGAANFIKKKEILFFSMEISVCS